MEGKLLALELALLLKPLLLVQQVVLLLVIFPIAFTSTILFHFLVDGSCSSVTPAMHHAILQESASVISPILVADPIRNTDVLARCLRIRYGNFISYYHISCQRNELGFSFLFRRHRRVQVTLAHVISLTHLSDSRKKYVLIRRQGWWKYEPRGLNMYIESNMVIG